MSTGVERSKGSINGKPYEVEVSKDHYNKKAHLTRENNKETGHITTHKDGNTHKHGKYIMINN